MTSNSEPFRKSTSCTESIQSDQRQKPPRLRRLLREIGEALTYDSVGPFSRVALRGLDFQPSFLATCPLTNPRMLWFCQSVAFAISAMAPPRASYWHRLRVAL